MTAPNGYATPASRALRARIAADQRASWNDRILSADPATLATECGELRRADWWRMAQHLTDNLREILGEVGA